MLENEKLNKWLQFYRYRYIFSPHIFRIKKRSAGENRQSATRKQQTTARQSRRNDRQRSRGTPHLAAACFRPVAATGPRGLRQPDGTALGP